MIATITTYGCREYLHRIGMINEGELVITPLVAKRYPKVADIQASVSQFFNIPLLEMKSARRSREYARPRQIAMYLAKQVTPKSYPEIGRLFGNRDHTTVMHACRQIEKLRREDPEMDEIVEVLMSEIEA
jgi:chromosomal replication initiator protein